MADANRSIATRLEDACAIEAQACFERDVRLTSLYSDSNGVWRIFTRPLIEGESVAISTGSLFLYALPFEYRTAIGQSGHTVDYRVTFQFVLPIEVFERQLGQRGWHDDPYALIRWLYGGGSHPNLPGNIFDPDSWPNPPAYLTTSPKGFTFVKSGRLPNRNVLIEFDFNWQTLEDSQGNKL